MALKIHASPRLPSFHNVSLEDLQEAIGVLYHNLGDWLLYRTEADVKARYSEIGRRRAEQGIPPEELLWSFTIAREHIIEFLHRQAIGDSALALFSELEFISSLTQFFDRAIYYAIAAESAVVKNKAVA